MARSFNESRAQSAPHPAPWISTQTLDEPRTGWRSRAAAVTGGILGAVC